MTYASGRLIHDADSHLMEPVDCLDPYFDKRLLARFRETPQMRELLAGRADWIRERLDLQSDAEFRADADGELMVRKNYEAQAPGFGMTVPMRWTASDLRASLSSRRTAWAISASTRATIWSSATQPPMPITG